jgi:GT2 family glycosyltransferase
VSSDVEVLIVSYNSADEIRRCLASLSRVAPELGIAVREHGSDAAALAALKATLDAHPAPTRFEHEPANPGFGAGCNALARSSKAALLLFLNPDAELVAWPWSSDSAPPRGRVIGPVMSESGHPGDHSGVSYRLRDEIARSWLRHRGGRPAGAGFVSGAALMLDAACFAQLDGFDESYFMYYEDIDLCLRANDAGIPTVIEPRWIVRHERAHSTRSRFGPALVWSYESGSRFHASRGTPLVAYRTYVLADALGRAAIHGLRGNRGGGRAYLDLARRVAVDMLRRDGVPGTATRPPV